MFDLTTREIFIYDDIGPAWAGLFGTETLKDGLDTFGPGNISLRINSYGGSVDEALAMLEMLARHDGKVTCSVDSIAASAASLFPCVFDSTIAAHGRIMIHNPWGMVAGDAAELRRQAEIMDLYRDSIAAIYEEATDKSRDDIIAMMDAETWFGAKQAVEEGFAGGLSGGNVQAAVAPAGRFKNIPDDLRQEKRKTPIAASRKPSEVKKIASTLRLYQLKSKFR